jgi:hypothetical protein
VIDEAHPKFPHRLPLCGSQIVTHLDAVVLADAVVYYCCP